MVSLKQASFSAGVVSPQLLGRSDLQHYATGLRTCTNAQVTRYGTIENRPGTAFVAQTKDSQVASPMNVGVRLVPFVSYTGQSYILEFGYTNNDFRGSPNAYMRPWKDGELISTSSAPAWSNVTAYNIGDLVFNTFDANTYYCFAANTGQRPDTHPTSWYLTGAELEIPFFAATSLDALLSMQYVQQNDVLTLASQAFTPQRILHYSDTDWVVQAFAQSTGIAAPTGVIATAHTPSSPPAVPGGILCSGGINTGIGAPDVYQLQTFTSTAAGAASGSLVSVTGANYGATNANPISLSWSAVGGALGYALYKQVAGVPGMGLYAIIEGATSYADHAASTPATGLLIPPTGAPGTSTATYVVTAISAKTGAESLASASATATGGFPMTIQWNTFTDASTYNIYRNVNGVYGFIGQQPGSPFSDGGITADTGHQPPAALSLFQSANDYPAVVAYYQQRLCFANTVNEPSTVWMSRVGVYTAFTTSSPVVDDDAVQFTLAGKQIQPIQSIVDLGKMIVHTTNGEYVVSGNTSGAITPSAVTVTNTGSTGASSLAPVVIGNTDLFVQQGATRLCDLRYEVQRFTFAGRNLTKVAPDLFRGRTITAMDWQKLPHSTVWGVLDNGSLLGLTYIPEEEMVAWHIHQSSNGYFEQVAVVPEGSDYALYTVVRRFINGATTRYIERFASRECNDTVMFTDAVFLDASLTYDGRNTNPSNTVTLTTSGGWTPSDQITITSSSNLFVSGDVGTNQIVLQQIDSVSGMVTDFVTLNIVIRSSNTVAVGVPTRNVPTWAQGVATANYGKAVKTFSGISHLEGQAIGALADGMVAANPLDSGYPTVTVSGGSFTLAKPALVVTAGLPIQMDLETLPIENAQGETIANRSITIRTCSPIFFNSRGGQFGQDADHLDQWVQPQNVTPGFPTAPYTGIANIGINGSPQPTGQVHIRLTDPVPFSISAMVLTGEVSSAMQ